MKKIKVFIITTELPTRISGAPIRNFNLIKQISKYKFSVSLFTIIDSHTKKFLPIVEKSLNIPIYAVPFKRFNLVKKFYVSLVKKVIPYMEEYKESDIANVILDKIKEENPDIIQLEQINAYYAIKDIIPRIKERNIKIVLDAHNVEQVAFKETLGVFNLLKKTVGKWILPNLEQIENEAAKSVDYIFTCSNTDKKYFANIVNAKKISVIPNGADSVFFRPKKQVLENILLYMGQASYPPNEEALHYYFFDIHPVVRKIIPDVKIYVLCGKSPQWLKKIARDDSSLILPGFVVDVRKYLIKAKVCIAPIKSGSGTRLKILEYMAMEKPIVASSKGAEGLAVENGKNILLADNPCEFSEKIVWLIKNPSEAKKMGERARKLVKEKYDWRLIVEKTEDIYQKITHEANEK
ncbi:MAG: glycosyltransferase family 4 protein [Candidatus Microgenomates bacterium]|jgi:glycosyltransferase involved in cell wall biosynthesis